MTGLRIRILGSGSALPTPERYSSAHLLYTDHCNLLIDCGEGTQHQLQRFGESAGRIEHIFISHLHGDHFFGLPGLLSSYRMLDRSKDLHIYGPKQIEGILNTLFESTYTRLSYPVHYHPVETNGLCKIFENKQLEVFAFPLKHREETFGYRIQEKEKEVNISKEFIKTHKPAIEEIKAIKMGADFVDANGIRLPFDQITLGRKKAFSYAYCSDTAYTDELHQYVHDVDVLYHEASFLKSETTLAEEKAHSTAEQAALVAKQANAQHLLIGHFSNRYADLNEFLKEACKIFPKTELAYDGMELKLEDL